MKKCIYLWVVPYSPKETLNPAKLIKDKICFKGCSRTAEKLSQDLTLPRIIKWTINYILLNVTHKAITVVIT